MLIVISICSIPGGGIALPMEVILGVEGCPPRRHVTQRNRVICTFRRMPPAPDAESPVRRKLLEDADALRVYRDIAASRQVAHDAAHHFPRAPDTGCDVALGQALCNRP